MESMNFLSIGSLAHAHASHSGKPIGKEGTCKRSVTRENQTERPPRDGSGAGHNGRRKGEEQTHTGHTHTHKTEAAAEKTNH